MERVPELLSAVQQGGSQVLVGYHFRYHPALLKIKQLLQEGAIGHSISVRAHWGEYLPGWHPWEDYRQGYSARSDLGGGVILTLSHPLDYLHWLFGQVASLWSFSSQDTDLDIPVESVAEIGLRFTSGLLGSLHLDYYQRPASHRLEVIGTEGTLYWDNEDGTVRVNRMGDSNWKDFSLPDGFNRDQLFLSEIRHFLDVVRGEAQPVCSLADGLSALKLCLAALESQRSGILVNISDLG